MHRSYSAIPLVTALALASGVAWAHTTGLSQSELVVGTDGAVDARLVFAAVEISAAASLDANHDGEITPAEIDAARPDLKKLVLDGVEVKADGRACPASFRGAEVTGVDFSPPAIAAAQALAAELGLPARFVLSDVYGAPAALPEPASFDLVFTTWGTIGWLPDIAAWARVVAGFLRPGGRLLFLDAHPAALVFDDMAVAGALGGAPGGDGRPGWFVPYFDGAPLVLDDPTDYADPAARLRNMRQVTWLHPLGAVLSALQDAGMRLDRVAEHPRLTWQMFRCLVRDGDGLWTWPDRPWLPLSLEVQAVA